MARISFNKINAGALKRSEDIVKALTTGRRFGSEWVAYNPLRVDKNLGSFRINLSTGKWADFATEHKGGDLISLVAYLKGSTQVEAAKYINNKFLGGTK